MPTHSPGQTASPPLSQITYSLETAQNTYFEHMKYLFSLALVLCALSAALGQHTFSIVAVDSVTGEIGSAGATCGDSIIWPGTPGAYIISDVLPGVGAIHSQAYWVPQNQENARLQMEKGLSPDEIISWLENNDVQSSPGSRQYGVVAYNEGSPQSAAYTGDFADDYKGHILGSNYAIQGNILLGPQILDSMEARFLRQKGSLALKLMAAMQGANVVGADSRCTPEGTSSLSAFIRMAKPDDVEDDLFLDINVAGTEKGVEPIDILQEKFDKWIWTHVDEVSANDWISLFPNPAKEVVHIESSQGPWTSVEVWNALGQQVELIENSDSQLTLSVQDYPKGLYTIRVNFLQQQSALQKVLVQ